MKKTLAVATLMVVALASSVAFAQGPGSCHICWRDGGYFDDNPWYCNEAEDFGYRNCAAAAPSCANWEPLCERGILADMYCFWTANGWVCYTP